MLCYMENGLAGTHSPSRDFCIYWYIDLKFADTFQNRAFLHCVKILSKTSLIKIFDDVIAYKEYTTVS